MELLTRYAMSFIGIPYSWGGENPMKGFDCSGYIIEVMKSVGVAPKEDTNAQGLYTFYFENGRRGNGSGGDVVFFGSSQLAITHVGLMLDSFRFVEAGGGDSRTTNMIEAAKRNAFVRIRHISSRKDVVAYLRPKYPFDYYIKP